MKKTATGVLSVLLASAAALLSGAAQAAGPPRFDGVDINVVTFTGPQIAEPLQRRAPDFEKLTRAQINLITVPLSALYTKLPTHSSRGPNSIQTGVFAPQWMIDYIAGGVLLRPASKVASSNEF